MNSVASREVHQMSIPHPDDIPTDESLAAARAEVDAIRARIRRREVITDTDAAKLIRFGAMFQKSIDYIQQVVLDLEQLNRQRQALRARADRGAYMGGPMPFGFTWNEATQEWETVDAEHRVLTEIRHLRAKGLGVRRIAAELNHRGVPTPKGGDEWRPSSVESILKNSFYDRIKTVKPD